MTHVIICLKIGQNMYQKNRLYQPNKSIDFKTIFQEQNKTKVQKIEISFVFEAECFLKKMHFCKLK